MSQLVIDFYGARPTPAAIKAAGYAGVLYYTRNPIDPRPYLAAGLGIATIFETLANESLGGAAAGTRDGQTAAAQMRAQGQPTGTLHTVNLADFAPAPGDLSAISVYWQAYRAQVADWFVLPYGTGWLLQQLNVLGWQNAMNDNGVLGSVVVPQAALYQRTAHTLPLIAGCAPSDYDEDAVLKPLPWWGLAQPAAPAAPIAPAPVPTPAQQGDNVQRLPFQVTLNAAGWTAIGLTLPAGMTKDNVINVEMDGASPFDGNAADPWEEAEAEVDYGTGASNNIRVIVKGTPGHLYTGRVDFS